MLAIDPFAQQIIRYHTCVVDVDGTSAKANIPRTNYFVSGGGHIGPGEVEIGPDIQSAINTGIFAPGNLVTPLCSTGNCSFPHEYDTLGYCGGCADMTGYLKFVEQNDSSGNEGQSAAKGSIVSSLPSGLSINSTNPDAVQPSTINHFAGGNGRNYNLAVMGTTSFLGDGNPELSQMAEFILAKSPYTQHSKDQSPLFNDTCQNGNSSWYCLGYGAARCTLNPCIRTYTASIESGAFRENLVSQTEDTNIWASTRVNDTNDYDFATIDTKCISPAEHSRLFAAGYLIDPAKRWLPYNLTFDPTLPGNSSFPSSMFQKDHECVYVMDTFTARSLWAQYLATFLNGTVSGATNDFGAIDVYNGSQNLQTIYNFGNVTLESIDSIFRNISDSLSTYIRQRGNSNHSAPVVGIVSHDDTCLEVRWGWLALPAAVVVATVVFFAITLIVTRPTAGRVEVWKSSPLALIFHGLQPEKLGVVNSPLREIRDMDRAAEGISVRLAPSETGVNLVAVDGKASAGS